MVVLLQTRVSGRVGGIRRILFGNEGSDCLRSGGGKVPYFNSCVGCPIGSAQQCVLDMRRNVSFNVAPDCNLGQMSASVGKRNNDKDRNCCARHGHRETYAFPDALRCLENLKCDKSGIFTELKRECDYVCPVGLDDVWGGACEPSEFDRGSSALRPSLLIVGATTFLFTYFLLS